MYSFLGSLTLRIDISQPTGRSSGEFLRPPLGGIQFCTPRVRDMDRLKVVFA